MTYKELNALVMVASSVLVSAWVAWRAATSGFAADLSSAAWEILWAIGALVVFNIMAMILTTIVVSILQRHELKDERADERDRAVNNRSMANAYFTLSIGTLGVLIAAAMGLDAVALPYALFATSTLAGAVFAASQVFLYRIG